MKKKVLFLLIVSMVGATSQLHADEFTDKLRSKWAAFTSAAEKYGRKAARKTKTAFQKAVDLLVFAQDLVDEAQTGLKKLEEQRDEFLKMGAEAQATYNNLKNSLENVQQEATKLYDGTSALVARKADSGE